MTALAKSRMSQPERWTYKEFTLASGTIAYQGGIASLVLGVGKVHPGVAENGALVIGKFASDKDASAADQIVTVYFDRERAIEWFANSGTSAVAATDIGALCFVEDDQTVRIAGAGYTIAGRVWGVDSVKGVAVERLDFATNDNLTKAAAQSWTVNDLVLAASPPSRTVYDIPTTTGASTVTLPATASEGTTIQFVADGTKNGHTVQYRDATGPTNLTTALTASKRHLVVCTFLNSKWYANAYVSP